MKGKDLRLSNILGYLKNAVKTKKKAFTIAELMVVLMVIGIVSTIVFPSFRTEFQSLIFRVQKKVLLARVSQAIPFIENIRNYETKEAFMDKYRDLIKIAIVCKREEFWGCELPQVITATDGTMFRMPTSWNELNPKIVDSYYYDEDTDIEYSYAQEDSESVSFLTDNGESINLFFNPECVMPEYEVPTSLHSAQSACINMIFDLNGTKPPNTVGKDIGFLTVFNPREGRVVAPVVYSEDVLAMTQISSAGRACRHLNRGLRAPTDYELASMFINSRLLGMHDGLYWSSTVYSADHAWYLWGATGMLLREPLDRSAEMDVRCVYR